MSARMVSIPGEPYVVCEFALSTLDRKTWDPTLRRFRNSTPAELADLLAKRCKEFMSFIRDHRSADEVNLYVESPTPQLVCSNCGHGWEPDNGLCASCGEGIE